ncbi:hypothetical protein ACLOJK_005634 [Asimina triloba]
MQNVIQIPANTVSQLDRGSEMGGGVLPVVGPAVGTQKVFSAVMPRPASLLSVPAPSSSSVSMPVSATSNSPLYCTEGDEWQAVDKDLGVTDSADRFVFGPAPSKDEVEDAVSALQQIFAPVSHSQITEERHPYSSQIRDSLGQTQTANTSELTPQNSSAEQQSGWIEVAGHVCTMNEALSQGFSNVLDALRLLQTNPSVQCIRMAIKQRMVVSLSSDKAVWDAVINNEAVQELRESLHAAKQGCLPNSSGGSPGDAANHLPWILDIMRMIMELMDGIRALVDHLFRPPHKENQNPINVFSGTVRSSFMLSIMVLLVVVMTRVQNA